MSKFTKFSCFKVSLYWGLHSNQMVLLIPSILALLYFMCKAQLIYMYKHERVLSCGTPMLNPAVKEPSFDQNCILTNQILSYLSWAQPNAHNKSFYESTRRIQKKNLYGTVLKLVIRRNIGKNTRRKRKRAWQSWKTIFNYMIDAENTWEKPKIPNTQQL